MHKLCGTMLLNIVSTAELYSCNIPDTQVYTSTHRYTPVYTGNHDTTVKLV